MAHVSHGRIGQRVKRIGWVLRDQYAMNMASWIEAGWRYIRRDTIGTAGSSMAMPLEVFAPSLVKHMSDMSEKHACKILGADTGMHMFPALPIIKQAV